jgi:hypothetical protein
LITDNTPLHEGIDSQDIQTPPADQKKEQGASSFGRLFIGVVISLVCLGIIFASIDIKQLFTSLQMADYRWVGASACISLAWLLVRALAWRSLLQNKARFSHVFFSINQGYLLNNVLPFRLGEVGRAFLLGRKSGLGFWQVLPTIVIERLVDLILAVGIFLGTLPFVVGANWAGQAAWITGGVMLIGLGMLFLLAHNRPRVQSLADWVGKRVPFLGRMAAHSLPPFLEGLGVLADLRRFLVSIGWLLLDWVIGILQFHLMVLAFFPQAKMLWTIFTLGAAALGLAAPSSPGGIGVYEFAVMTALAQFVDAPATAAALAFTAHLIQILFTGLLGAYALYRDGDSLVGLYRQVRGLQA